MPSDDFDDELWRDLSTPLYQDIDPTSTPPLVGDEFDGGCMFPIPGSYILARIPALMLYAFCIFSQRKCN